MSVVGKSATHDIKLCWRRFKELGDGEARNELVLAYSPLVKYVAGRVKSGLPAHVEEEDLVSYGLIGLIDAIERFEPGRNVKFETYALSRIKGAIIDELRALDWVPRSVRMWARRIEQSIARLESGLGRAPSDDELAQSLGITPAELDGILLQISHASIVALDEFWTLADAEGEKVGLFDTLEDEHAVDPSRLLDLQAVRDCLAEAIRLLPERERTVIGLYYYQGLTLREIGEVLGGVTESRVSQLHTKAILRLKGHVKSALKLDSD